MPQNKAPPKGLGFDGRSLLRFYRVMGRWRLQDYPPDKVAVGSTRTEVIVEGIYAIFGNGKAMDASEIIQRLR